MSAPPPPRLTKERHPYFKIGVLGLPQPREDVLCGEEVEAWRLRVAHHRVRLARAGLAVGEARGLHLFEHALHQRACGAAVDLIVVDFFAEDLVENKLVRLDVLC